MDGNDNFFTILMGLVVGFIISKILIDWAIGITPDHKNKDDGEESTPLNFNGLPKKDCDQHRWRYDISKRLFCDICKKRPS